MTIEQSVAALTSATTALTTAVGVQQASVTNAVAEFLSVTNRVNEHLNLVDNTTDLQKPVSTATALALSLKQATLVSGQNISTVNGQSLLGGEPLVIERSATSLNFVAYNNRNNLRTASPEVDDATMVEGLGLFMWINSKDEPDDDETCFTTTAGQWLLQAPAWDLINAWKMYDDSIKDDWHEDEPNRFATYLLNNKS